MRLTKLAAGAVLLVAACGVPRHPARSPAPAPLPPDYLPLTVGRGLRYRPAATSTSVRDAAPIDGQTCTRRHGPRFGAHLEIFAYHHVVAIPAGIGIAPPLALGADARVLGGRCSYSASTTDPTGVIDVRQGARMTLGELFDIWGQPLGRRVIDGFRPPAGSLVVAYVDGRRFRADARRIMLFRHARIVLEVASHVPPHRDYLFPEGL